MAQAEKNEMDKVKKKEMEAAEKNEMAKVEKRKWLRLEFILQKLINEENTSDLSSITCNMERSKQLVNVGWIKQKAFTVTSRSMLCIIYIIIRFQ